MEFFYFCDAIAVQDAKAAVEETEALQTRVHQAEAAQEQTQGMELDYGEVIHLLEAGIAEMKSQLVDKPTHYKEALGFTKGVTALEWQLCKSETANEGLEVSTGKLFQFVEVDNTQCGSGIMYLRFKNVKLNRDRFVGS